jgi:hypothetical protein
VQAQVAEGRIAIELLRPPTLAALQERLQDKQRPVHILHFDGHGTFAGGAAGPHEQLLRGGQQGQLAIKETLDVASGMPWNSLQTLANIAALEGRVDAALEYRRRERETFAAFEGNRWHIDQQHGRLIAAIAAAARGHEQARAAVEELLPQLEANGWHIADATRRIWAGERGWDALVEELDRQDALLVLRVLEEIASPTAQAG